MVQLDMIKQVSKTNRVMPHQLHFPQGVIHHALEPNFPLDERGDHRSDVVIFVKKGFGVYLSENREL